MSGYIVAPEGKFAVFGAWLVSKVLAGGCTFGTSSERDFCIPDLPNVKALQKRASQRMPDVGRAKAADTAGRSGSLPFSSIDAESVESRPSPFAIANSRESILIVLPLTHVLEKHWRRLQRADLIPEEYSARSSGYLNPMLNNKIVELLIYHKNGSTNLGYSDGI
jgi:hypothetical protein